MKSLPVTQPVAATSVGIWTGEPLLDLCYEEDSAAEVDMNLVMTGSGRFVELQATAEKTPFDDAQLEQMIALARRGIAELFEIQKAALAELKLYCATTNPGKLREFQHGARAIGIASGAAARPGIHPGARGDRRHVRRERAFKRPSTIRNIATDICSSTIPGWKWTRSAAHPACIQRASPVPTPPMPPTIACCLRRMRGVADRTARFVCVVALAESRTIGAHVSRRGGRPLARCATRKQRIRIRSAVLLSALRLHLRPKRRWSAKWRSAIARKRSQAMHAYLEQTAEPAPPKLP